MTKILPIECDSIKQQIRVGDWVAKDIFYNRPKSENDVWLKKEILRANGIEPHVNFVPDDAVFPRKPKHIKSFHKQFTDVLGGSFYKRLKAISSSFWIDPKRDIVNASCFYSTGWSNYYCEKQIMRLWKNEDIVDQAWDDNQVNILPLIIYFGASPEKLRKRFGKSIWKRICASSKTTNKLVVQMLQASVGDYRRIGPVRNYDKYEEYLDHLVRVRPSLIANIKHLDYMSEQAKERGILNDIEYYKMLLWLNDNCQVSKRYSVTSNCRLYIDTATMAAELSENFNARWSLSRMKKTHDLYVMEINKKRYSDEPIDWLSCYHDKITLGDASITVLKSPAQIAIEGAEMHHCVSSYIYDVVHKHYIVLALKHGDQRSTLGLYKNEDGKWKVDQHYGPCNHMVSCKELLGAESVLNEQFEKLAYNQVNDDINHVETSPNLAQQILNKFQGFVASLN